jgi:hypothetical protein
MEHERGAFKVNRARSLDAVKVTAKKPGFAAGSRWFCTVQWQFFVPEI